MFGTFVPSLDHSSGPRFDGVTPAERSVDQLMAA